MSDSPPQLKFRVGRFVKPGRLEPAVFVPAGDAPPSVPTPQALNLSAERAVASSPNEAPAAPAVPGGIAGDFGVNKGGEVPLEELVRAREMEELAEIEKRYRAGKAVKPGELKRLKAWVERCRKEAALASEGGSGTGLVVVPEEAVGDSGLNAWWLNGGGSTFFVKENTAHWLEVKRDMLEMMLRRRGLDSTLEKDCVLTGLQAAMLHIAEERTLARAVEGLAGYESGIFEVKGKRILVKEGPRLLKPVKGAWLLIQDMLDGRFTLEGSDRVQVMRFHYWLKRAVTNYYLSKGWLNSHILMLAGPAGCGKSLLQHEIITPLVGGRSSDPSLFVFGGTAFNQGWMGSEHLLIEDPKPNMKMVDRLQMAQILKGLAVNRDHMFHAKTKDEFGVDPQFVVTISINDDLDALRILPPLTPDFEDKVMLLHVQDNPLPVPTGSEAEREEFRRRIREELPHYLHWLLYELEVPQGLKNERFGVQHYHEPELRMALWEDSPASEFLALLDVARWESEVRTSQTLWEKEGGGTAAAVAAEMEFRGESPARAMVEAAVAGGYRLWVGSAAELQELLESVVQRGIARKIVDKNSVGRMLGRLAEDAPDRVCKYRPGGSKLGSGMANGRRRLILRSPKPEDEGTVDAF